MINQDEIERGVLGSLLMVPEYFEGVKNHLNSSLFTDSICQVIFKNIEKRFENGRSWDVELLTSDLPELQDSLHNMFMTGVGYLEFLDYVKNLQLESFVGEIREATNVSVTTDISEVQSIVDKFDLATTEVKSREFMEIVQDAILETVDAGTKSYEMPYHYRKLTDITKGAMRQNVHLIVAETGHSKTVFAWNLQLRPLEMGFKVNFYDYEMPDISMVMRGVAMKHKIPLDWMDKGKYHTGSKGKISEHDRTIAIQKMQSFGKEFEKNLIIRSNFSIEKMEKDIIETRPDIVVVDTIQAFCSMHPIKNKTKADHITDLCQQLETMAKKYNVAMFQTAQVNRQNDGLIPKPSHIKESGGIAEKAGTIFCVRDKFKSTKNEKDKDVFDLEITKSRHGQMGYINFMMNPAIAYISESFKTKSIEEEREIEKELPPL